MTKRKVDTGKTSERRRHAMRSPGSMATLVRDVLVPVEPSQLFVRDLGRSLTMTAVQSRQSLLHRYRKAIVIAAAAFGSLASVAGVVALILRQRARTRAEVSQ